MGSQDEQVSLATNIANDALQNITNYCSITCTNDVNNVDITIIGGESTINLEQTCSAVGAECLVKNVIQSQIDNMIDNMIKQSQSNLGIYSLLGPSSTESANIANSIKNQVSQLITNNCAISSENSITNVSIFAQDADTKLNFVQNGSVSKASCALDTVAKLVLNNQVTNSVAQTQSSCGDILWILIVVAVIIFLVLVGYLVFKFAGSRGGGGGGSSKGSKSVVKVQLV
jgi:hypothetical protein